MSAQQINFLKRQKAYAWAKYYEEQNKTHERVVNVVLKMNNFQDDLPLHLIKEFEEMAGALKRMVECPVCLEVIPSGHLNITPCGHKYCKNCRKKLTKCAICRKEVKSI